MRKYSRGEFLSLSAMLAGSAGLARLRSGTRTFRAESPHLPTVVPGPGMEADLIVVGGRVLTMDPALPRAEGFAVKDGRFLAVGSEADVRNLASARTKVIDARQTTVLPGFIDCHSHPSGIEELYEVNANVRTVAELQGNLRQRVSKTPPGQWVDAYMFDDTKLDRPLTRRDLDAVSTQHPISVNHRGGHTSWYNGKALELAGITMQTPDPSNGRFFREHGELTGRVGEMARDVFEKVGARARYTPDEERARARSGMKYISSLMAAAGLTSVTDASTDADKVRTYEDVYRSGDLSHRAYMLIWGMGSGAAYPKLRDAGVYTGLGDEWVRVGGVKFQADGSASERTMRMSTPYVGTKDYGILTMTEQEIDAAVEDAHRHNWQVGIHANGDVAIDMVLKAYERALKQWPHPDRRHRVEHCSLINPDLVARLKASGTIPTPFWTYVYYHGEKWEQYGDEKMRSMFAHKSFLDAGIRVPGASDYAPGPFEPLMAIQSMVTRRDYRGKEWGPNQKVTVDQALMIATQHGAYPSYEERTKGSITAGKWADFVMLEKDPHDVDPLAIKDIRVVRTVAGGRTTHDGG